MDGWAIAAAAQVVPTALLATVLLRLGRVEGKMNGTFRKSGPSSNGKSNQGGADAAPR